MFSLSGGSSTTNIVKADTLGHSSRVQTTIEDWEEHENEYQNKKYELSPTTSERDFKIDEYFDELQDEILF